MSKITESFSSRFGLIAATLGMAIGAGNIWRFPRVAGQYGGSFLIPWLLFLFLWSIPLLIVEFSIGKKIRSGAIGAFSRALGSGFTWMGIFVGFCTTAILFYYSVVCGWSLKYFLLAVSGHLGDLDHASYWTGYAASTFQPLLWHLTALLMGSFIIYKGIVHGIEKFSKIIVPLLYLLLIIAAFKAITLPGSGKGISYFFSISREGLMNYRLWLEALSQSAWSTGAGWGLLLTYAIYARKNDTIVQNSFVAGIGNNMASVFAGLAIIPTIFALSASPESANEALSAGNQGLAFIVIPQLFSQMTGGGVYAIIFFLTLFFAALSSLISMIELAVRMLIDFGLSRRKALLIIASMAAVIGAPSAVSLRFFNNQDWVWGLGLLLSGLFFAIGVIRIGVVNFINEWLKPSRGRTFFIIAFRALFYFIIPLEFLLMMGWWLFQSIQWNPANWWNPFTEFSIGTCLLQWAVIIGFGLYVGPRWSRLLK